jgi:hypothetical protein
LAAADALPGDDLESSIMVCISEAPDIIDVERCSLGGPRRNTGFGGKIVE